MSWVKHNIDLDPITIEVRERVNVPGGFTTRKVGEDMVSVRIIIDTGKIRTLAKRAALSKCGTASLHFGAIVAKVMRATPINRVTKAD